MRLSEYRRFNAGVPRRMAAATRRGRGTETTSA